MNPGIPQSTPATNESGSAASAQRPRSGGVVEALQRLSNHQGTTSEYYRKAFRILAKGCRAPYAAINVQVGAQTVEDRWQAEDVDPLQWVNLIDAMLLEAQSEGSEHLRVFRGESTGASHAAMSLPIQLSDGHSVGAIVVVMPVKTKAQVTALQKQLKTLVALIAAQVPKKQNDKLRHRGAMGAGVSGPVAISKVADYTSIRQLAFAITNSFAAKMQCEQVALGIVKRNRIKLLSISGMDELPRNSPGVVRICQAMEECLDSGKVISCRHDAPNIRPQQGHPQLHEQWSESADDASVCSVPIILGDMIIGVLSLRRSRKNPFCDAEIEKAQQLLDPFAPALIVIDKANRSVATHARDALGELVFQLTGLRHIRRKLLALGVISLMVWLLFGHMRHTVSAPCTIAPARVRHVGVPFSAVIKKVHFKAGDRVAAGDLLVELDTSELELERERLIAELQSAQIEKRQAIVTRDISAAALAEARMEILHTQLQHTNDHIARSSITAFATGTVILGDLSKRIGQTVQPDETLLQIAPDAGWYVQAQVEENSSTHVKEGQLGWFTTVARPDHPIRCRIQRIVPSADVVDGKNVFLADLEVEENPRWMRVGMKGVVRIDAGRKPVWWVAFHGVIDFVRLKFWI